jgi:hypothetical protein
MNDFQGNPTTTEDTLSLVVEESQSFVDFEQWMDEQLERLVAQWVHTAAPNAALPRIKSPFGKR